MITATQEPLPEPLQTKLRSHLNGSETALLVRVLESKANTAIAKATSEAFESSEYEAKLGAANENLRQALRYQSCAEVLKDLAAQKEQFTTVKLT